MIYKYKKCKPKIDSSCFIAPSAEIIGDVELGSGSSVWFNATIRADLNKVRIGKNVSIQDNCSVHVSRDEPTDIADDVVVGHGNDNSWSEHWLEHHNRDGSDSP